MNAPILSPSPPLGGKRCTRVGAEPAYNLGDHRGCYDVYSCTARMLLRSVEGADDAKQRLPEALEQCSTQVDVNEMAGVMRHAFDATLGEPGPGTH